MHLNVLVLYGFLSYILAIVTGTVATAILRPAGDGSRGWRRGLAAAAVAVSVMTVIGVATGVAVDRAGVRSEGALGLIALGLFVTMLGVYAGVAVSVLRVPWGRGLSLAFLMFGLWIGAWIPAGLAVRAVAIEGFVVPTGAMAPTVCGEHYELECGNCGIWFAVGPSPGNYGGRRGDRVTCPNCDALVVMNGKGPATGDRLVADKTGTPRRWDLIVFRNPQNVSQNYIKRLVGMPGDSLTIRDGEVYVDGKLLTKPADQQHDMWFLVHDGRLTPKEPQGAAAWESRGPGRAWKAAGAAWSVEPGDGPSAELVFARPITGGVTYNLLASGADGVPMGDVKLEFTVDALATGPLEGRWAFGDQAVVWRLGADGAVTIESGSQSARADAGAPAGRVIGLAVRDGVASVLVDGAVLTSCPLDAGQATGDGARCSLTLRVAGGSATVRGLRVWRDVYYTNIGRVSSQLADDQYFGLGDNSPQSADSRLIGPIPVGNLIGVARWCYWPPSRWHAYE